MRLRELVPPGSRWVRCAVAGLLVSAAVAAIGCGGSSRRVVQASELPRTPVRTTAPDEPIAVRHVVEAGQTLWRIAKVYGVSLEELARANGMVDPTALEIGQTLIVPGAADVRRVPAYPAPWTGSPSPAPSTVSRAPFEWPVLGGRVLSHFGAPRRTHRHAGIDIGAKHGQRVHAAESGRVVYSGSTLRGYGRTIVIEHGNGLRSLYAHNSELLAREGDRVRRGQVIARAGHTGNASADHCHFEIRKNDVPVDPTPYLTRVTEGPR